MWFALWESSKNQFKGTLNIVYIILKLNKCKNYYFLFQLLTDLKRRILPNLNNYGHMLILLSVFGGMLIFHVLTLIFISMCLFDIDKYSLIIVHKWCILKIITWTLSSEMSKEHPKNSNREAMTLLGHFNNYHKTLPI